MERTCTVTGKRFIVTEREQDFLRRIAQLNPQLGIKSLPLPDVHPVAGIRQLALYGNLLNLYRSTSNLSGRPQLSRYNPVSGHKICTTDEFFSDEVDNAEFGRSYDFTRPFFEQWNELMRDCYLQPLTILQSENSDFVNGGHYVKNCYLMFASTHDQDCMYGLSNYHCSDTVDCLFVTRCQFCYACNDSDGCYECRFCSDCSNCSSCFGCLDCRACNDCFGCIGLVAARYVWLNEQKTPVEYARLLAEARLETYSGLCAARAAIDELRTRSNHTVNRIINSEDCSGSYIVRSRSLEYCFHASNSEDCGYLMAVVDSKNCWHGYAVKSELCYKLIGVSSQNCHYTYGPLNCEGCWYSFLLFNRSSECFGCVGLKGKSYCILNKQYSKTEYYELLPRIVAHMQSTGEWGQWFPAKFSPHTYDECWSDDYIEEIPASEVARRGLPVRTALLAELPRNSVAAADLPDSADDPAVDGLISRSIICPETGSAFNLQKREIEYCRRMRVPIARHHWKWRLRHLSSCREKMKEYEV